MFFSQIANFFNWQILPIRQLFSPMGSPTAQFAALRGRDVRFDQAEPYTASRALHDTYAGRIG